MKRLWDAAYDGNVAVVVEVLGLWRELKAATQQRYLATTDPDGETAYQLSQRGHNTAATKEINGGFNDERAKACEEIAFLLLTAQHQTIDSALKVRDWEGMDQPGQRFYGLAARAPFQKQPALPEIDAPVPKHAALQWSVLHEAAHEGDLAKAVDGMARGADPLRPDTFGRTPRTLALLKGGKASGHAAMMAERPRALGRKHRVAVSPARERGASLVKERGRGDAARPGCGSPSA